MVWRAKTDGSLVLNTHRALYRGRESKVPENNCLTGDPQRLSDPKIPG